MTIGCCGSPRPVSLAGLIAQADAYPARSFQGRQARARLAYTIVAGRAAQAGNRPAFERAMQQLGALGTDPVVLTTHGTAADTDARAIAATEAAVAAAPQIQATLASLVSTAGGSATALAAASSYINIVLGLVNVGTGIAGAAGGDANAIRVVNMVVSWIRTLLTGAAPQIPPLDAATVRGLVAFCGFRPLVNGMVETAIGAGSSAAALARNAGAVTALATIGAWLTGIVDGICNIPQLSAAAQAQALAADCGRIGAIPNPARTGDNDRCICPPGTAPNAACSGTAGGCMCVPVAPPPGGGGPIMLTSAQRRAVVASRQGRVLTSAQQQLLRTTPMTLVPGTLDPGTLCAPGETPNPSTGICDGGSYSTPPASSGGGKVLPLAVGAAALWFLFK